MYIYIFISIWINVITRHQGSLSGWRWFDEMKGYNTYLIYYRISCFPTKSYLLFVKKYKISNIFFRFRPKKIITGSISGIFYFIGNKKYIFFSLSICILWCRITIWNLFLAVASSFWVIKIMLDRLKNTTIRDQTELSDTWCCHNVGRNDARHSFKLWNFTNFD